MLLKKQYPSSHPGNVEPTMKAENGSIEEEGGRTRRACRRASRGRGVRTEENEASCSGCALERESEMSE